MSKFFNKWARILHRWLAVPTLIIIPVAVTAKLVMGVKLLPPQFEQIQSLLILLLAISGAYLYFLPYLAKWQRRRRTRRDTGHRRTTKASRPS